jgi:hypothetical protein
LFLPSTELHGAPDARAFAPKADRTQPATMMAIVAWLSSELDLPSIEEPPTVRFVPPHRMADLRHRDVSADRWDSGSDSARLHRSGERPIIIAVYDDDARTIYLPEGWSGHTPAELSELVHEMVHHIQNVAGGGL